MMLAMAGADDGTTTGHQPRIERPARRCPDPRQVLHDLGTVYAANGLIGIIFAATGPVAIILAVGAQGGLTQAQLASWIFGAFFLNGVLTVLACWLYRQPLSFFWTIPGTVLVGPALGHLTWAEVVGAFLATGVLIAVLGLSGWVRRVMALIPMPIVMAMVAGMFLRFGLDLVYALRDDFGIAAPMVVAFVALSALPAAGPPGAAADRHARRRRRRGRAVGPLRRHGGEALRRSPRRCSRPRRGRRRRWWSSSCRSR